MCRLRLVGEERFWRALKDDARGAAIVVMRLHVSVYSVDDGMVNIVFSWYH